MLMAPFSSHAFEITPELVYLVAAKYGQAAVHRLEDLRSVIEKSRHKNERMKIKAVNDYFNRFPYSRDIIVWKKEDHWATPIEMLGMHGADCEDYSIAKYFTLREMGVPVEKLQIMYLQLKPNDVNQPHMVLAYYETPTASPLILDNMEEDILPADAREDITPIYSFNSEGVWLLNSRGKGRRISSSSRIKLWSDMNMRLVEQTSY